LSYSIKPSFVQIDFNDNNTLISKDKKSITIIDLGEIVISHPFISIVNFLHIIKKHYGLKESDDHYKSIESAYFSNFRYHFDSIDDMKESISLINKIYPAFALIYQERFIRACGKENLIKHNYWKLGDLLKNCLKIKN
jgi:hypothetical protein